MRDDVLQEWLRRRLETGAAAEITGLARAEGGFSSETWLIDLRRGGAAEHWVLRIEPRDRQIYEDASVERQFRIARALHERSDLPIAAPLLFEPDDAIVGAPFFVMQRLPGVAPPGSYHTGGVLAQATPAEREAMWREGIGLLAMLDRLDPTDFAFLAYSEAQNPGDGVGQELARWNSYRRWTGLPDSALLNQTRHWLADHRPPPRLGVAWGDARLCNLLFAEGRCTAMLDWETASLGRAETDLGWWIFYDEMMTEGIGVPRLAGIGDRAATVAAWEEAAGRRAEAIDWHVIFAGYRFVLISDYARVLAGVERATQSGSARNPAVDWLERLLERERISRR